MFDMHSIQVCLTKRSHDLKENSPSQVWHLFKGSTNWKLCFKEQLSSLFFAKKLLKMISLKLSLNASYQSLSPEQHEKDKSSCLLKKYDGPIIYI